MNRHVPMQRRMPLRSTSSLSRSAWKKKPPKKRAGHESRYLAACRGESCFLNMPGCPRIPNDESVVPAHQNQGKGMGLKVPDRFTVPACYHCHYLYDQSSLGREFKRAAWDWAYTRWEPVRANKMGEI